MIVTDVLPSGSDVHPVKLIPNSTVSEVRDTGEVGIVDSRFRKSVLQVDNVILAMRQIAPELGLEGQISPGS